MPVYFDMLDSSKAEYVIDAYTENYFSSDWGVRILREDSPIFNPRGYHTGSVWPLFTGWSSLAEYKYGNDVQGFTHVMDNILVYKNWALGFVEEVLNGAEYKPSGVCRHQCWSETMALQPVIEGMLGLKVDAVNNKLTLSPSFPADWDLVNVGKIKIGDSFVNFKMKRIKNKIEYYFSSKSLTPIEIEFNPSLLPGAKLISVSIEDKILNNFKYQNNVVNLNFKLDWVSKVEINYNGGISVLPSVVLPKPGYKSEGFRILNDKISGDKYVVKVQGLSGSENILRVFENGVVKNIKVDFERNKSKYIVKTVEFELRN